MIAEDITDLRTALESVFRRVDAWDMRMRLRQSPMEQALDELLDLIALLTQLLNWAIDQAAPVSVVASLDGVRAFLIGVAVQLGVRGPTPAKGVH